jgi:hypothetical protein
LVFTGDHVRPDGYEPLRRAGLLPATVQGTAGPDLFYFATWDKEHPVLRPLSDPQQGDLRRVTFHHITRLQPAPRAKVLAATQAGDPLLVEGRLGTGKVLVVATAADRDWSNWPQSRLYVPLVHQIVGYLADALPEDQRVRKGQTGPGRLNPPGVTVTGRTALVRNLDPAESEMERLSTQQFRAALRLPEGDNPIGKQAAAAAQNSPDGQRADELWAAVLWALLVVLMIELFVANRTHG